MPHVEVGHAGQNVQVLPRMLLPLMTASWLLRLQGSEQLQELSEAMKALQVPSTGSRLWDWHPLDLGARCPM